MNAINILIFLSLQLSLVLAVPLTPRPVSETITTYENSSNHTLYWGLAVGICILFSLFLALTVHSDISRRRKMDKCNDCINLVSSKATISMPPKALLL